MTLILWVKATLDRLQLQSYAAIRSGSTPVQNTVLGSSPGWGIRKTATLLMRCRTCYFSDSAVNKFFGFSGAAGLSSRYNSLPALRGTKWPVFIDDHMVETCYSGRIVIKSPSPAQGLI
jgi:hypothetical protein